ncbi:DUF2075 domain-containing protein [Candidatus Poseidoniales archaeon]|nr:DUF2075 domain-containing protein [Candidatus Poseidoniales archaeon]MDA8748466.1 DUF2075 domain-containing protein [Candidatus Poseidoniales archaeon]
MRVYSSTCQDFIRDVGTGQIAAIVERAYTRAFGHSTSESEIRSWKNSLAALSNILDHGDVPSDLGLGIEFQIPKTSKRIDVLLSGTSALDESSVLIVELKQWEFANKTTMDGVVNTFVGGGNRDVQHPSYQSWSYAQLLRDFAVVVEDESMILNSCAYLHNMATAGDLKDSFYSHHLLNSPSFIGSEGPMFRGYICSKFRNGDSGLALEKLEHSDIKPSKSLADAVKGMLDGNEEFTLLDDQKVIYEKAVQLATKGDQKKRVFIVRGGPGTGKSVLAVNLLSKFISNELNSRYITKNSAPRLVYAARLSGHLRKSRISALFTGSGSFVDCLNNEYDALIVDEAHRLNAKSGMFGNLGENQVKEIIQSCRTSIFFIDEYQRIHLKDVGSEELIRAYAKEMNAEVFDADLTSQFRCGGSDGYLAWIDNSLGLRPTANTSLDTSVFDFQIFDDPKEMYEKIIEKNNQNFKSRLVAGYCWNWISKKDPNENDIILEGGKLSAKWNLTQHGMLWIEKDESISEIGCIHTCQGLELDYVGVIIGPDLQLSGGHVITEVNERAKSDASIKGLKKMMKENPAEATRRGREIVLNTYRTLLTRGMKGCYVYCTDKELANHLRSLISA